LCAATDRAVPAVGPAKLLDRQRRPHRVDTGPAIRLGDVQPEQADGGHRAKRRFVESGLAVAFGGRRANFLGGELVDRGTPEFVLGREAEIHAEALQGGMIRRKGRRR
jgi:hypothetical protein